MSFAVRSATGGWSNRTTFVLALSASAIGLGNLWRFAYLMGEHGGAPFLLVYLFTLFAVAVPVLIAEVVLGSQGRSNPMASLARAADRAGASRAWAVIGWLACAAALLMLSYYSVVAGWALAYIEQIQSGAFADASAADIGRFFDELLSDPLQLVQWQTLFLLVAFTVSAAGIIRGGAVLFWVAIPTLLVALGVLINYALLYGDMDQAGRFLFAFNLYDFSAESALIAMGQAFYTLGIGVGVGIAFGAYAPEKIPLGRTVIAVALFDAFVGIAAGVAIFAIAFAGNLQPSMGPALIFVGLPYAFGNLPQGDIYGGIFFFMLSTVAIASTVALAEPAMSYLVERLKLRRPLAAFVMGSGAWILSLSCALSFNQWRHWRWRGNLTLFELIEFVTSVVLLPLVCLSISLLVGYRVRREVFRVELYRESRWLVYFVRGCLRYIAPPVIIVVMLVTFVESF